MKFILGVLHQEMQHHREEERRYSRKIAINF